MKRNTFIKILLLFSCLSSISGCSSTSSSSFNSSDEKTNTTYQKSEGMIFRELNSYHNTCSVSGNYEYGYEEPLDIIIPRRSPTGQLVTEVDDFIGDIHYLKIPDCADDVSLNGSTIEYIDLSSYKWRNYRIGGCKNLKGVQLPQLVSWIPDDSFCGSTIKEFHIPSTIDGIGNWAFMNSAYLEKIVFQSSLKIGEQAFSGCDKLKYVNLEDALSIGENAFENCTSLSQVDISCMNVEANAFKGCRNLKRINLEYSVECIDDYAFYETNFHSIYIPDSVTMIRDNALVSLDKNAVIYCESERKDAKWLNTGWDWNPDELEVKWGVSREEYVILEGI